MTSTHILAAAVAAMLLACGASAAAAGDAKAKNETMLDRWNNDDAPFSAGGITLYGTYDVGYSWLSNGPVGPKTYQVNPDVPWLVGKFSKGGWGGWVSSPLEQSKLGLKGSEKLVDDLSFVFKAETGFDALGFNLIDGPGSLGAINGTGKVPPVGTTYAGDSTRAGQIFNGALYGGLSHKALGTLTYGRQNAYLTDVVGAADPMGGGAAFGLLGWTGQFGGGGGDSEDKTLDNALKYTNTFGSAGKDGAVRIGGLYQFGTIADGGPAWQGGVGFDWKGLSIDGVYAYKQGAVSATWDGKSIPANQVDVTLSDNTIWALTAKYDGGKANYKLFAGYENISQANSSNPEGLTSLSPIIGAYVIAPGVNGLTNNAFDTNKVQQMWWVGGSYKFLTNLTGTAAYYQVNYGDYIKSGTPCKPANSATNPDSNCAGQESALSALLDYQWTKRVDLYGGIMYSKASGGYTNNFQANTDNTRVDDNTAVTVGTRVKF